MQLRQAKGCVVRVEPQNDFKYLPLQVRLKALTISHTVSKLISKVISLLITYLRYNWQVIVQAKRESLCLGKRW